MTTIRVTEWFAKQSGLPQTIEFETLEHETEKAVLIKLNGSAPQWIPRSQLVVLSGKLVKKDLFATRVVRPIDLVDLKFADRLYDFQRTGVSFLMGHDHAILGDEMGTGKTIQLIDAARELELKHVLVVCPNSIKGNWARELATWWPNAKVQIVEGWKDDRVQQIQSGATVKIINYEALRLHTEELAQVWDAVIFDEAHRLKNRTALVFKAAKAITTKSKRIWHASGTPVMNRGSELWSLLNILEPSNFRSFWKFVNRYCYSEFNGFGYDISDPTDPNDEKLKALQNMLASFMLRRTKAEVLPNMPSKTITKRYVKLEGKQMTAYKQMKKRMRAELDAGDVTVTAAIAQITRLRQICIDPQLMLEEPEIDIEGAKIDALMEVMDELEGKKVVIFTQFAKVARAVDRKLEATGFKGLLMTGSTDSPERDPMVQAFQTDPSIQYFICTTQVGGVGLTLTAASTGIFLDKMWNPKMNEQAQDRMHRIGQTEPVQIIEILTEETIEERIELLLAGKNEMFDAVVEGAKMLRILLED